MTEFQCPLLGVKRTSTGADPTSAFDPNRTSMSLKLGGVRTDVMLGFAA